MRRIKAAGTGAAQRTRRGLLSHHVLILGLGLATAADVSAGELVLYNGSARVITCSVDGYTTSSGASTDSPFRIGAGQQRTIPVNPQSPSHMLDAVECEGLKARSLGITADSSNRLLLLNGRQRRVLNALLYASIPTDPKAGFAPLVKSLETVYQAAHPDILLNLVLDPGIDVYDFKNLKSTVFGANGFDVVELDTVFLKWLKEQALINPIRIMGEEPWPVAKQAVIIDGNTYGVPSWLCSDFLFSTSRAVKNVRTFLRLQAYMAKTHGGTRALVGDLDGSWTIPAAYIQAFVQSHPSSSPSDAVTAPVDAAVVARMSKLGTYCALSNSDPCIDGTFHGEPDGAVEKDYVTEHAASDMGFSERSFFIMLYQPKPEPLSLVPLPWGDKSSAPKLAYSDAFVTNRATCATKPCAADAADFAAFMTSVPIKKTIALSADLLGRAPFRHLIVSTKAFYDDREVKADPIYGQIVSGFLKAGTQPYLTSFTPQLQYDLLSRICPVLQQQNASWKCKIPQKPD